MSKSVIWSSKTGEQDRNDPQYSILSEVIMCSIHARVSAPVFESFYYCSGDLE